MTQKGTSADPGGKRGGPLALPWALWGPRPPHLSRKALLWLPGALQWTTLTLRDLGCAWVQGTESSRGRKVTSAMAAVSF